MRKKKHLGQHFLRDQAVLQRIVETVDPKPNDTLIEIGPGAGALTTKLLPHVNSLDVIEIDQEVIPELEKNCNYDPKLHIHVGDVLKFDFAQFKSPVRLVGNLPYNISTPLLFYLMKIANPSLRISGTGEGVAASLRASEASVAISSGLTVSIQDMHFMLQKEVAERIVAAPGSKAYGRLSVMVQYHCETKLLFYIGSKSFSPPPKVASAFIRLVPRKESKVKVEDEKRFADIVRDAFNHRRKTIANGLKDYLTAAQLEEIGIDPKLRPEQLSVAEFANIAKESQVPVIYR